MAYLTRQPDFSGDFVAGLCGRSASRPRHLPHQPNCYVVCLGFIGSDSHHLDEPSSSRAKLLVEALDNRLQRNCRDSERKKRERNLARNCP